jgi:hypothetical protein
MIFLTIPKILAIRKYSQLRIMVRNSEVWQDLFFVEMVVNSSIE